MVRRVESPPPPPPEQTSKPLLMAPIRHALAVVAFVGCGWLGLYGGNWLTYAVARWTDRDITELRVMLMWSALAGALVCALATPSTAQLLQRKDLSLSVAQTIANGALEACKGMGYAASVAVVNRDGETLVSLRGDGTGPHTVENARRKAYTANTFKMSTQDFIDAMKTQPTRREQTTLPSVIAINGGVPIKVGNEVIGGVGLSGSPGKDEECVKAGLEKVKGQLQ